MLRNTKDIWLDFFRKGLKAWTMIRMVDKSVDKIGKNKNRLEIHPT